MKIEKLTHTVCTEWTPEDPSDPWLWDQSRPGLGLRVYPSGSRSFFAQYRSGGRQRRMSLGKVEHLGLKNAWDKAREVIGEVLAGGDPLAEAQEKRKPSPKERTLEDLAHDYQRLHSVPNKAPKTSRNDESRWRRHILPVMGKRRISEITPTEIAELHLSLSESPTSANRTIALLSNAFAKAILWGWLPPGSNPTKGLQKNKEKRRGAPFKRHEVAAILDYIDREAQGDDLSEIRQLLAIQLLAYTAMRPQEVFPLRWEWVDWDDRVIALPSDKKDRAREEGRNVGLSPRAIQALERLQELADGSAWVFPSVRSDGAHMTTVRRAWDRLRADLGLKKDLYSLRHAFATGSEEAGLPLGTTKDSLGHKDVSTTEIYRHGGRNSIVRKAAEVMQDYYDEVREGVTSAVREAVLTCGCDREIRISADAAKAGPIRCEVCGEVFSEESGA